jgi:hypothetical protein
VASPIPLPAQPARRGGRMLSELAPAMATTLSLNSRHEVSRFTFQYQISFSDGFFSSHERLIAIVLCDDSKL